MSERLHHLLQRPWEDLSYHHVEKALSTYLNNHGRPSLPPCWKGSQHLHQRPWEAQPSTMLERLSTYINDHVRPILPPCQKGSQHLHQQPWEAKPATMSEMLQHLHQRPWEDLAYNHVGKAYVYLRLPDLSLPLGRNLDLKYTKILSKVFKLHSSHF